MDIKLIVSDIDGTLVDSSEQVATALIEMIHRLRTQGILFTVATGRNLESARTLVDTMGIDIPYILCNGACVFAKDRCVEKRTFSMEPLVPAMQRADAMGMTITVCDEYRERALRLTPYVEEQRRHGTRFTEMLGADFLTSSQSPCSKVMIYDHDRTGRIADIREMLQPLLGQFAFANFDDRAVEAGPKGCSKATGLESLSRLLNIPMDQIMACGDYRNDLEMLRAAGVGVAVDNACQEVKQAADYRATRPRVHGVLEAIERYCL